MSIFTIILFVLLTPGVLLRIPPKGSLLTVAIVHGIVFALIYHLSHKVVLKMLSGSGVCISGMCHDGHGDCINKGNGDSC
jgi:hypothetical protein